MTKAQLRKILDKIGVNQSQLGRAFGVPDRQVRRWIAGDRTIPDDVANHLKIIAGELMFRDWFSEIERQNAILRAGLELERARKGKRELHLPGGTNPQPR